MRLPSWTYAFRAPPRGWIDPEFASALDALPTRVNELGYDAWGFSLPKARVLASVTRRIYDYFHPEILGIEKSPGGRVLLVANHSGQLPLDGDVITIAALLHGTPPRLLRTMVERWFPSIPTLSQRGHRYSDRDGSAFEERTLPTTFVTAIAGGLAQRVAEGLLAEGHDVVGVDYRPVAGFPVKLARMKVYKARYDTAAIEDVFRWHSFDSVLHLGHVGNLSEEGGKRFALNVVGSQKILTLCAQQRISSLVVLSTFHICDANPRNHVPIGEDDPLRAATAFPEIADASQLDALASAAIYETPEVRTVVLRPTNVVGPTIQNTMSRFFEASVGAVCPRFQPDGAAPLRARSRRRDRRCVVRRSARRHQRRGPRGLAVAHGSRARRCARSCPLRAGVATAYLARVAGSPRYLVNFCVYPCVIADEPFRTAFSWTPQIAIRETLVTTVSEARALQRGD